MKVLRKLFLSIGISFLLAANCFAMSSALVGSSATETPSFSCDGYDRCQQLEGTGYDNSESGSWTETIVDGTIDEDYSTTPIAGAQSLWMFDDSGSEDKVCVDFTAHGDGETTGVFFQMRVDSDPDANHYMVRIFDWSSIAGTLTLNSAGTLRFDHGTASNSGTTDVSGGQVFDVWIDWSTAPFGTGNVATCLHSSCDGVRPDSEDNEVSLAAGTADFPGIDLVCFYIHDEGTIIFDTILIKEAAIGDVSNIPAAE